MADEGDVQVQVDNQEAQEPDEPGVVDNLPDLSQFLLEEQDGQDIDDDYEQMS